MKPNTPIAVPRMEDRNASEFSEAFIWREEGKRCGLSRCPDAGNGKAQSIEDGHPVVFGHPGFPNRRQEWLQLGEAFRKEARPSVLRSGQGQRSDGADLAAVDESHEDAFPLFGGDPAQKRFDPSAAPRSGSIPVFRGQERQAGTGR